MKWSPVLCVVVLVACAGAPEGLRPTPDGNGPLVVIDWDAEPLPELPFPNDLAMRNDPTSPTGLRVNISEEAPTEVEARSRRKINEMTGFGIYMPISVRFDAPLDLDEIARRHDIDGNLRDDAFYVIDVTPTSPTYLQAVELDVGHGRFPLDVDRQDVYFPNDVHIDMPSLVFDTHDEDVNGNGELDWGEDIDNDGWLDVPNVYPAGGDPREDLLTWYERLTDTLIFRPVVPLREETTYAVILTERLVGEDGEPVRSPWEFVNHTRQTDALQPICDALPALGLRMRDVAYAWTYTTGRVTGDLVDIRLSLDGKGPFSWLPEEYPPGVVAAHQMNEQSGAESEYLMDIDLLTQLLGAADLVPGDALPLLQQGYAAGEWMVGGEFVTPNLLADRDDGGGDMVDEWWQIDPVAGTLNAEPETVAFTCVLPEPTEEFQPPFDVVFWGHGYGSSRFETFSFAWAFLDQGVATCTIDWPGHGPSLSASDREELSGYMDPFGLMPLLEHVEHSRYVDTDNDGVRDSGSHQWTGDAFHTRDMVRQAAVDWMWLLASLQDCGQGTMDLDGQQVMSCDWNEDGVPDIGGPDAAYMLAGGSLGGMNNTVATAVMPDVSASVPVVAGGGLMDISLRAPTGGAVEAMHGKVMSPLILGRPNSEDGTLRITQYVNNFMDMEELTIGTLSEIPVNGRIVVENLYNGEVREGWIPADGRLRVGIPADALDYYEKRLAAGIPDTGVAEGEVYSVVDNAGLGDLLLITVFDANGDLVAELDTFETDGFFEGVTYLADSPLVAAASGLGRIRATPETRRLLFMVSMATEPGDPIAYAPHLTLEPFAALGGQPRNVLLMPTPGDMVVSVNSEIAVARAAGFYDWHTVDERYGMTVDEWLIDRQVIRGLEQYGPWTCADGSACLFDADDFDDGTDEYGAPSDAPLRATIETSSGVSGMRIPYANPRGSHGFGAPEPDADFDINGFALNQIGRYLVTHGQEISDDPCMEDNTCPWQSAGGGDR